MKQVVIALLLGSLNVLGTHKVLGLSLLEHTDIDGVKYVYQVEEEIVEATPAWDGKSNELPLSFGKAVTIATNWVTPKVKNNAVLEVQRLSLSRIHARGIKDKWYYHIDIDAKYKDTRFSKMSYMVVILLDGTIVEPEIYKKVSQSSSEESTEIYIYTRDVAAGEKGWTPFTGATDVVDIGTSDGVWSNNSSDGKKAEEIKK